MINSQHELERLHGDVSISKGMGDQFSALHAGGERGNQYIKGDG